MYSTKYAECNIYGRDRPIDKKSEPMVQEVKRILTWNKIRFTQHK